METLFGFDLVSVAVFIAAWLVGSILAYRFIFIPIVLPFIQKCLRNVIIRIFTEPDEEELEALYGLLDVTLKYFSTREIKTGKTLKVATDEVDAEGHPKYKELPEVLTPIELIAQTIGTYVIMKVKGQVGGTKHQMKQMLMQEASESGVGLSPAAMHALARGKVGPALAEVGLPFLLEKMNKGKGNIGNQGGGLL